MNAKLASVVLIGIVTSLDAMRPPVRSFAEESSQPTLRDQSLKTFLRQFLDGPTSPEGSEPARYFPAFVDLKDHGAKELIVYVEGRAWCGSGGRVTLILVPKEDSYRVIARATITWRPIRVLTNKTNGWHDIGVLAT
jgi:hypothetical protein